MKHVTFYEKPGCKGNARQKKLLTAAGYTLTVKSVLSEPWSCETLRPFFGSRPVADWFNPNASEVKNGTVNPETFHEEDALKIMLNQPILIRRPLIKLNGDACCGFDEPVLTLLGLSKSPCDLEACRQITGNCDWNRKEQTQ